ncbi:hypothetical protein [Celerinatantimonas sp. MCCC 1A17872]|uniref:hypothetical protein n=1 Tax=Celerinatantimonas sp. MCCC 1A17872 TaxID=3177514 RepID=UPI0038C22AE1
MRVFDWQVSSWFLFEHQEHYYLDVNCSIGAFGYSFMLKMTDDESRAYSQSGYCYLQQLAQAIAQSAPIAENSSSAYRERAVSSKLSDLAAEAFLLWKSARQ